MVMILVCLYVVVSRCKMGSILLIILLLLKRERFGGET